MESGIEKILSLGVWYGIFCFVMGEVNPMDWSTVAKVIAVIIALLVVDN
jgi:hypothetical protein